MQLVRRAQRNVSDDFLYEIKPVKCVGPAQTEGSTHAVRRRKTNDRHAQTTTGSNNNYGTGILIERWNDQIFKKILIR